MRVLSRFLKVDSVDAVRMSDGRLFQVAGPATENAQLPRRSLVRGTTRSPQAAERRATRVETDETGRQVLYAVWCRAIPCLVN